MSDTKGQSGRYRHLEVDNAVCMRRFHVCYEEGTSNPLPHVEVKCPHCGVTVFEADNHVEVMLARDENLVSRPDGSRPIVYECRFPR